MRAVGVVCAMIVVGAALTACSPQVATRGHLVEDRRLEQIQVGQSTANDVLAVLGSPSTVAPFDDRVWYYIGQRTERTAFFRPEVIERRVIKIVFDDSGMIREMDELGVDDGMSVELVERETPTLGRRMGFLEQMVGNIGRFNPSDE